jgi:amino-acid N-acetyltransferase
METNEYSQWFRGSTPYISAHRGKTFVVFLGGDSLEHLNITNIVHDLALLHVLGVRLVLVHGGRQQLDNALGNSIKHNQRRVTHFSDINIINGIYGQLCSQLEGLFSTGLPNTPMHNVEISVVAGNFVTARPIGVLDGIDHLFTGRMRSIDSKKIMTLLDSQSIVLISPMGYSPSGQAFNLAAEELAADVSVAIAADKLIMLDTLNHLANLEGLRESTVTPTSLEALMSADEAIAPLSRLRLATMARAVRGGVAKAHIISFEKDGGLLQELFTAGGVGTQVLEENTGPVRAAKREDVSDIVEIIRPLEESGVLVRRSRDRLEEEIDHFLVAELDGIIVGCCAIYPIEGEAELACVAVHEHYRRRGSGVAIGSNLLRAAEQKAREYNSLRLFALTTQAQDWFIDQGFAAGEVSELPSSKQSLYNWQRGSKVVSKLLS